MNDFKHKTPIQLRFKDMDMMGHVNNANYLTYIELARLKYFEDVIGSGIDWNLQHGIILAHLEIDYRQPILYGDKVFVYTRCSRIGNKSFDLNWIIVREKKSNDDSETEILAEGKSVLVCYDYAEQKAIEIREERKQKIIAFEGIFES